ncbi:MAG: helix-turn-helix domain-containing protein [Silvanigrellaceae bacterium]|nr:helix-turn-helix domain-containing protein [Silvanigrellaceae bacterium]
MVSTFTPDELESLIGENVKSLRLLKNLDRVSLCEQAGISLNALKNLENGQGTNLMTLIRALKALGNEDWVNAISPKVTINPLHMVRNKPIRQRASRKVKLGNSKNEPK